MTNHNEAYDTIIVLGAQVRSNWTPSEALRRRMALALTHYQERPTPIICCGAQGHNEPCAEGDFMCEWLVGQGVALKDALSENQSFDTMENIRFAKKIMQAKGYARALVVTSDYHLRRALAICRYYGVNATGAGSPSLRSYWIKNHARELLAWVKFYLFR